MGIDGHGSTLTTNRGELPPSRLPALDASRYTIAREVARGGAGRIMEATDRHLGRTVALKFALEPAGEQRLVREARLASRLQHPSIVQVFDAGLGPDDNVVIAMKLVEGRSLREVITASHTLVERLTVLPTILAVAEAIAYAHSRGIIHRDLKPANVLVGAYGETVVVDWGLAKDLAEPADGPLGVDVLRSGDATATGAIMGTPAYMAPEQARGEALDERADVYAVGAMLYHLLAGAPPFQSLPDVDVMTQVATRAPIPLDRRVPGIPRDLTAIVAKAMACAPEDRYDTAAPLAKDLRAFQAGKLVSAHDYSALALVGRYLRRHRAVVAIAAVAVVALASIGALTATRVIHERDRAERQRAGAEDLAEFMMSDLRERLDAIGRLDALRGVGEKVEGYYSQIAGDDLDALAIRRRARALRLAALVRRDAGDLEGERAGLDAALRQHAALRGVQPIAEQSERVALLLDRGELENQENHLEAALADQDEARALAVGAVGREPIPATRATLIDAENGLGGTFDRLQRLDQAQVHFRAAYDLEKALLATEPADGPVGHKLALTSRRLGRVLMLVGKPDESLAIMREATDTAKTVAARRPDDASWLRDLAGSNYTLAGIAIKTGHAVDAVASFEAAIDAGRRLVAHDGSNVSWAFNLVQILDEAADSWPDVTAFNKRLALLDEASRLCDRLVAHDPKNRIWRHELVNITAARASVLDDNHRDPGEVAALYARAVAILEQLTAEEPNNGTFVVQLGVHHTNLATALVAAKRYDEAEPHVATAIRILEAQTAVNASNLEAKKRLSYAYGTRVELQRARGDATAAEAGARRLLALDQSTYDAGARDVEQRILLVQDRLKLGQILAADRKRADEARALLRQALGELDAIQSDGEWLPSFEPYRTECASTLRLLTTPAQSR